MHNEANAKRHVELVKGDTEAEVRIRLFEGDKKKPKKLPSLERSGKISNLWPWIVECQDQGYDVFLIPNADTATGAFACDDDIKNIRVVFIDGDGIPIPEEWRVSPDFIVWRDATHWHAYWVIMDCSPAEFTKLQQQLAAHYKTDPSIHNPSRVMRLAGTRHQKDPNAPYLVTLKDLTDDRASYEMGYTVDQLAEGLPDVCEKQEKPSSASKNAPVTADHLRKILGYIDPALPKCTREVWLRVGGAIHNTNIIGDEGGNIGREIFHEWCEGKLDRLGCYKEHTPDGYESSEDTDHLYDTMPPRPDGVAYGTIFKLAQDAGYDGPPYRPSASEAFRDAINNSPAEGQAVGEISSGVPGSDDDLATAFARAYSHVLRYVGDWNKWYGFNGRQWKEIKTPAIWNLLRSLIRKYTEQLPETPAQKRKLTSKNTVANVEALARGDDEILISADILDADLWLLNTPGGIVDLRTGELYVADPQAYCTKSTAVTPAPTVDCPLWLSFLHRITGGDMELMAYLQRAAGYCLTGDTSEHALFCFIGTGANGKSVFLNALTGILQDYATVAPAATFTAAKHERHPTDMAMLHGARLVAAQETNQGQSWDEAKLKAITGGDRITARKMHQDFFTFTPQLKLVVATNHKPKLHNVDEAVRRRLHIVPFSITIPKNERDHNLPEKLKAEWPGILQWTIQGCLEWQKIGLAAPEAVVGATGQYFETQDPLSGWLEERCIRESGAWTARNDLYRDYEQYIHREGGIPDGRTRFFEHMESNGFRPNRRGQEGRGFTGASLRPATASWQDDVVRDQPAGVF